MRIETKGTTLGLLIAPPALYAVQLRSHAGSIEITDARTLEMPKDAALADTAALTHALRRLLREMNLSARSAAVAIASSDYSLRTLRLPEAPLRERRSLVRNELEQVGAVPHGGGGFDFLWLPNTTGGGGTQAEVPAYYCSDAVIESVRTALKQAGLRLDALEPASTALMRAYIASQARPQPIVLLCPAEKYTDLCIHDGAQVRQLRRIPAGWKDFAPAAPLDQENPFAPPDEAAPYPGSARNPAPLPIGSDPFGLNASGANPSDVSLSEMNFSDSPTVSAGEGAYPPGNGTRPTTMPGFGRAASSEAEPEAGRETAGAEQVPAQAAFLLSEVARSLALYARQSDRGTPPQALVVLGPSDVTQTVERLLTDRQPLPVIRANPLAAFTTERTFLADPLEGCQAAAGAAIGMLELEAALPQLDMSVQETAIRARQTAPRALLFGMAGSTAWFVLSAIAAIALTFMQSRLESERGALTTETEAVKAQRAPLLAAKERSDAAKAAQGKAQVPASSILGAVAAASPLGVSLTGLAITPDGKLSIDGKAVDINVMRLFDRNLGMTRSIRLPVLQSVSRSRENNMITFHIAAAFREGAPK